MLRPSECSLLVCLFVCLFLVCVFPVPLACTCLFTRMFRCSFFLYCICCLLYVCPRFIVCLCFNSHFTCAPLGCVSSPLLHHPISRITVILPFSSRSVVFLVNWLIYVYSLLFYMYILIRYFLSRVLVQ